LGASRSPTSMTAAGSGTVHAAASDGDGAAAASNPPQTPPPTSGGGATQPSPRARVPTTRKQARYSRRNIALANARSKNPLFRAVHPLHLAVIACMLIAMGALSGAIATHNWFVVSSANFLDRIGIFKQCRDKPTKLDCVDRDFSSFTSAQCARSEADLKLINTIVMGLCFGAIGVALLTVLTAALARAVSQPCMSVSAIVFSFLAFGGAAATLGVFMWHKERWEFCDKSFCDWYAAELQAQGGAVDNSCEASYGYSAGLVAIGIGACLVAFVFAVLRFVFREWNIHDDDAQPNTTAIAADDDLSPKHRPRAQQQQPPHAEEETRNEPFAGSASGAPPGLDIPPPPDDGDWAYDAESGMYWSEHEFLFLEPYTQHSYDPNSDMWYDPDAEEWYEGEPADGGAKA